jgi:phenylalanyl-tRNA synthetase alpha chain
MSEQTTEIESLTDDAIGRIADAATLDDLKAVELDTIGKKGSFARLKRQLGSLDPDERRRVGQLVNDRRDAVEAAVSSRKQVLEAAARREQLEAERLDLTEHPARRRRGHLHITTASQQRLEDVFVGMGFTVAEGPEVETDWFNFEALNIPPSHPARGMWDTLYVDVGEPESTLLRTHTSPVQIRVMQSRRPPIYSIMPGRTYRRDTADATHTPVFHQIEGLVVDHGISFADLAGTLEAFTKAFFGADITSRLRPSYFPFTEPSAEYDISTSDGGWLELGGCGMVHPNVLRAVDLDPEEWTGFAFGFGIDRMAKTFHGLADLRDLFLNDVRLLEQF